MISIDVLKLERGLRVMGAPEQEPQGGPAMLLGLVVGAAAQLSAEDLQQLLYVVMCMQLRRELRGELNLAQAAEGGGC